MRPARPAMRRFPSAVISVMVMETPETFSVTTSPFLKSGVIFTVGSAGVLGSGMVVDGGWLMERFLSDLVEAGENGFLEIVRGVQGEEGDLAAFFHGDGGDAFPHEVSQALHVIHGYFQIGEGMLGVFQVPALVIPGGDELCGFVVPTRADRLEKESGLIAAIA